MQPSAAAGTRNAIRHASGSTRGPPSHSGSGTVAPPQDVATPATTAAIVPPSAKLEHQTPITRPRTLREKNSPMFFASGAQPLDWQMPCRANNAPRARADFDRPMVSATATLPAMPASTTTRVPTRSPRMPQRNWPAA